MPEKPSADLAELKAEVTRLRQALWEVLVAVDELAYVVEFSREQEIGTRTVVDAVDRARDILSGERAATGKAPVRPSASPRAALSRRRTSAETSGGSVQ